MQALDSTKVLGFDPRCQKYDSFVMKINKRLATFILKYHNFDNRPISRSQVLKIEKSILDKGWKLDGDPIRFNTDGNLSEAQHRLTVISEWENEDDEFEVVIVTGVQPESFTTTAPNKPRTYKCEIRRKDKEATAEQIATLNDLTQRRGKPKEKLCINNAIEQWNNWKSDIKEGISISSDFLEDTVEWSIGKKTVRSFATFCVRYGYKDEAEVVFDLLRSHLIGDTNTLAGEALDLYAEHAASLSNDNRIWLIFTILCGMTDTVIKNKNAIEGKCQFGYDISSLNKKIMKQKGVFNRFTK